MIRKHPLFATLTALLLAGPAMAQETAAPQMTPEMQAMMAAYQKAGTPGAERSMEAFFPPM